MISRCHTPPHWRICRRQGLHFVTKWSAFHRFRDVAGGVHPLLVQQEFVVEADEAMQGGEHEDAAGSAIFSAARRHMR